MKRRTKITKKNIFLTAAVIGAAISLIMGIYVNAVSVQLWQQSISGIMESTQQGLNTLRIQLEEEYQTLGIIEGYVEEFSSEERASLEEFMRDYSQIDRGVSLLLSDGSVLPGDAGADETAAGYLNEGELKYGIIDPHISSVTGVNVFQLFNRVLLKDGTTAYLIKEYEVGEIVDSFSLSFYQESGFSYVVDSGGNVLIRPPHPNSNKTVQNLFDMLKVPQNHTDSLDQFAGALTEHRTGWAVFS